MSSTKKLKDQFIPERTSEPASSPIQKQMETQTVLGLFVVKSNHKFLIFLWAQFWSQMARWSMGCPEAVWGSLS